MQGARTQSTCSFQGKFLVIPPETQTDAEPLDAVVVVCAATPCKSGVMFSVYVCACVCECLFATLNQWIICQNCSISLLLCCYIKFGQVPAERNRNLPDAFFLNSCPQFPLSNNNSSNNNNFIELTLPWACLLFDVFRPRCVHVNQSVPKAFSSRVKTAARSSQCTRLYL